MRNITINLPDAYVKLLEKVGKKEGKSRSELIRIAIKDRLEKDLPFFTAIEGIYPDIQLERKKKEEIRKKIKFERWMELKKRRELDFYNYCIVCDRKLHPESIPLEINNFKIFELRFCCLCYEKYKGKILDELPEFISKKIQIKLERYKKIKKN